MMSFTASSKNDYVGEELPDGARILFIILGTVYSVVGVFGNIFIMVTIVVNKSMRNPHYFFIANLALADLVLTGYVLPHIVLSLALRHYPAIDFTHCVINGFTIVLSYIVSLLTLMVISINRYLSVCQRRLFTRIFSSYRLHSSIAGCVAIWVLATLCTMPCLLGWGRFVFDKKTHYCGYDRTYNYDYTLFLLLFSIGLPVVVVFACNLAIWRFVRKASHRIYALTKGKGKATTTTTSTTTTTTTNTNNTTNTNDTAKTNNTTNTDTDITTYTNNITNTDTTTAMTRHTENDKQDSVPQQIQCPVLVSTASESFKQMDSGELSNTRLLHVLHVPDVGVLSATGDSVPWASLGRTRSRDHIGEYGSPQGNSCRIGVSSKSNSSGSGVSVSSSSSKMTSGKTSTKYPSSRDTAAAGFTKSRDSANRRASAESKDSAESRYSPKSRDFIRGRDSDESRNSGNKRHSAESRVSTKTRDSTGDTDFAESRDFDDKRDFARGQHFTESRTFSNRRDSAKSGYVVNCGDSARNRDSFSKRQDETARRSHVGTTDISNSNQTTISTGHHLATTSQGLIPVSVPTPPSPYIVPVPETGPLITGKEKSVLVTPDELALIKTLFIVFITFALFMSPYMISTLADYGDRWSSLAHVSCTFSAFTNCCLNCVLYGLLTPAFKKAYIKLVPCVAWVKKR